MFHLLPLALLQWAVSLVSVAFLFWAAIVVMRCLITEYMEVPFISIERVVLQRSQAGKLLQSQLDGTPEELIYNAEDGPKHRSELILMLSDATPKDLLAVAEKRLNAAGFQHHPEGQAWSLGSEKLD